MPTIPRDRDQEKETASLGGFRPPLIYGASIAIGLAFHWRWPRALLPGVALDPLGGALVVASIPVWRLGAAVPGGRHAGTCAQAHYGDRPDRPYRFSRNPIYVAFSLLQLGIAVWVNSWWLVATLAATIAIIHYVVVPREAQYLETRFGASYRDYKASVRRWL
jgi:protein-S-isoprenylcysteine O-methyltransferase Ste14